MTTQEVLVVPLVNESRCTVRVHARVGVFAVHPRVRGGRMDPAQGWAVTHAPSGVCVWSTETPSAAQAVAEWLVRESVIPADLTAFKAWNAGLSDKARQALAQSMQRIAPRYPPPDWNFHARAH